jgi:hypothetical protein
MKTTRLLLAVVVSLTAVWLQAQTSVDFVGVTKIQNFTQTTSTVNSTPTSWDFDIFLDGQGHSATYPAPFIRVVPPGGTAGNQDLVFVGGLENHWNLSSPQTFGSAAALDAAFANGLYSINFGTTSGASDVASISVNLAAAAFPNAPEASVTNGTWGGGVFTVTDPSQLLTISSGNFGLTDGDAYHIGISVDGNSVHEGSEIFDLDYQSGDPDPTFLALGVAGNILTNGTYTVRLEFNRLLDPSNSNVFEAQSLGAFTSNTTFTIQVGAIPEPSTYAAIFGAVALAGVMLHRRRRTV